MLCTRGMLGVLLHACCRAALRESDEFDVHSLHARVLLRFAAELHGPLEDYDPYQKGQ